jgi:uncharacterized membrane protein
LTEAAHEIPRPAPGAAQPAPSEGRLLRAARALQGRLAWPLTYGVAAGAGGWLLRHPELATGAWNNKLAAADRAGLYRSVGLGVLAVVVVYALAPLVRRLATGAARPTATAAALDRWLRALVALPVLGMLTTPGIESSSPEITLLYAAMAAVAAGATFYELSGVGVRLFAPREPDDPPAGLARRALEGLGRAAAPLAVLALWVGYGLFFSRLAITNHHALNTHTIDLGYYDNIFYQSIHGHPLGCSFIKTGTHETAHFDPILVVLSPLYLLYQRTELLLVLQSFWLGSGVVPVYLLARRATASRLSGVVLATMFAVYPAVHGANMYEFHSLTLIGPLVVWLLYFLDEGRRAAYYVTFAALLLCREDVPLLLCFVGLYALLTHRPDAVRVGRTTILVGIVYFVIAKVVFMKGSGILNAGKDAYSYEYYYEAMNPGRLGVGGILGTIAMNPVFTIKTAFEGAKPVFLLLLFLPLGFLPFFARRGRVMMIYGLLFTLLASRGPVFTVHFQYTSVIYPILFMLTAVALRRVADGPLPVALGLDGRRFASAWLAAAFVASLLVSWKFGGIADNQSFRGGFGRVVRELTAEQKTQYAWLDAAAAKIPRAASVGTTNRIGPHVSNRKRAFFYPEHTDVDYLLLDEGELGGGDLERHDKLKTTAFEELERHGRLALFRKKR